MIQLQASLLPGRPLTRNSEFLQGGLVKGYVDNLTVVENVREVGAATHYSQATPTRSVHAPESEVIFSSVDNVTKDTGMSINPKKTQLLYISPNSCETNTYVRYSGEVIRSSPEWKILGFWFDSNPGVGLQVTKMLSKARSRLFAMIKLRSSGMGQDDLLKSYTCFVRPILDYTCPTYYSQLTKDQADSIEQLQSRVMKTVFCILYSVFQEVTHVHSTESRGKGPSI